MSLQLPIMCKVCVVLCSLGFCPMRRNSGSDATVVLKVGRKKLACDRPCCPVWWTGGLERGRITHLRPLCVLVPMSVCETLSKHSIIPHQCFLYLGIVDSKVFFVTVTHESKNRPKKWMKWNGAALHMVVT